MTSPPAGAAAGVIARLSELRLTVAAAESLTAGLLCASLTEVPGASAVVRGGLVVYATDLKASLAGVDPALLAAHGAVHPEVAGQLADGARRVCGADIGLGLTGAAGPDPQDGAAVGTVHLALASSGGRTARALRIPGGRGDVRGGATAAALELLREHLG